MIDSISPNRSLICGVLACVALVLFVGTPVLAEDTSESGQELWLTYPGESGKPGNGKHILLIAADQEYRSEQAMPMLAKVLATHHGFNCTVVFSVNEKGEVDPTLPTTSREKKVVHRLPGFEKIQEADLVILLSRFITLPEAQFQMLYDYLDSGKPIISLRSGNHGFTGVNYVVNGKRVNFGRDVLGGTFMGHHGRWHRDSTRGTVIEHQKDHPVVRGVEDIWGPTDVYRTFKEGTWLPEGCTALVMGQPLMGRNYEDEPNPKLKALPVAWVKTWTGDKGKTARVFQTTMGSGKDFQSAGLRRLVINASYWCLELEDKIDPKSCVDIVGEYKPLVSGFNYEQLGVKPRKVSYYK